MSAPVRLLTPADVAAALQIGRSTAYALLKAGQIPTIRAGGSIRVHPDDLTAWIDSQRLPQLDTIRQQRREAALVADIREAGRKYRATR